MSLTNHDVQIILGMIARGDKQHDIAAWFGENQARIVEAEKGSHGSLTAAAASELFPKGSPGLKGRKLRGFVKKALDAALSGDATGAAKVLQDGLAVYDKNEA